MGAGSSSSGARSSSSVDVDEALGEGPIPNTLAGCRDELLQLCTAVPGYSDRLLDLGRKHIQRARIQILEREIEDMEAVMLRAESVAEMAAEKVDMEMSEDPEKKKKDLARLRLALAKKLKGKDYQPARSSTGRSKPSIVAPRGRT